MVTAGIDCGAKNVKVIILEDGTVIGRGIAAAGMDTALAADKVFDQALSYAGCQRSAVARVVSTGVGKNEPDFKNDIVSEVGADAAGIHYVNSQIRTIIDVGAEEGRAIKVNETGKVIDFAINEKCAAGAGVFIESMARALEIPIEDFGALSLGSARDILMNTQCVVFAESEVVSLVHRNFAKTDIARAINKAIADRISSMVRLVGITPDVALIGGISKNVGFVALLKEDLNVELIIPDENEFIGAIGAACIAAYRIRKN